MKCICISCFDHYQIRTKGIMDYFAEREYETTYVTTDFNHFSKKRYCQKCDNVNTIQIHVPAYEKNMSANRLISHLIFSKNVRRLLMRESPDVVYCMFPPNSLVKEIAKYKSRHQNIKLVFDFYDSWPESFPYSKYGKLLQIPFRWWRGLRDRYIGSADLIVAVSKDSETKIHEMAPGIPSKVLLPAIDVTELPHFDFDVRDMIAFLYLGNINHITDVDLGVELLGQIAEHKKTELHIIGGGQFLDEFAEKLENRKVIVHRHGVIFDMEEKNRIFSLCQIGLNIPREEIQSSMALKAVEYMRAGLPFLNSGVGDSADIVEKYQIGLNIDRNNMKIDSILKLNEQKLQAMNQKCMETYCELFVNQNYGEVFGDLNL